MKIILITTTTPASENIRGTSALPYHLMVERSKNIEIEIYSYNINNLSEEKIHHVEQELNVRIHLMRQPRWTEWLIRLHLLMVRIFLRLPYLSYLRLSQQVVKEIKVAHPDGIWVYGEEIAGVMGQFPCYKRVHIGPDSEALYYYRMIGQRFVVKDWRMLFRQVIMYPKYLRLERTYLKDETATYCVVGEADARFIKRMNPPCKALFLRHPHYAVARKETDAIRFHKPIRLLVAGRNDLYMQQSADELFEAFCHVEDGQLKAAYEITFLGKGWEKHVTTLSQAGWKVNHIAFAPNYGEEVMRHDVQLVPITIGTGTKGKVLDALANGLLVIGTPYAMENIAVTDGESCFVYEQPERMIEILKDILQRLPLYEQMAENGRRAVLTEHRPCLISEKFFNLFN